MGHQSSVVVSAQPRSSNQRTNNHVPARRRFTYRRSRPRLFLQTSDANSTQDNYALSLDGSNITVGFVLSLDGSNNTDKVETQTLHHVAAVRNYLIRTYSTHGLIQYLHRMIQRSAQ